MSLTFADTSLFVAFLNERDRHHASAVRIFDHHTDEIMTSQWVLTELGNYLAERPGRSVFPLFIEELKLDSRITIEPATDRWFEAGLQLYAQRSDKLWSLVDCISFAMMHEFEIVEAFTADHHFGQAGFRVLLQNE